MRKRRGITGKIIFMSAMAIVMLAFALLMSGCAKEEGRTMYDSLVLEVDEKKQLGDVYGFAGDCTYSFKGDSIAIYSGIIRGMSAGSVTRVVVKDAKGNTIGSFDAEVSPDTYKGYGEVENSEGWYDAITVDPVTGLPGDFSMGMDISTVKTVLDNGGKFYNSDGNRESIYKLLKDNGITYIRLRLWNEPYQYDTDGNKLYYGGGICDFDTIREIAADAKGLGFKVLLNFHYSDFWADPTYQIIPKMWADIETPEKMAEAIYQYTYDTVTALKEAGAMPDMVQIGNEITSGMLLQLGGEEDGSFDSVGYSKYVSKRSNADAAVRATYSGRGAETDRNLTMYVKAGVDAVKAADSSILTMIQLAKEMSAVSFMKRFYHTFDEIDFDVIGLSYYPRWHGPVTRLAEALAELAAEFPDKRIAVVEVSYAYTYEDAEYAANQFGTNFASKDYEVSVQGQANLYRDVINALAGAGGRSFGVFVWEGAWLPVKGAGWAAYNTSSSWANQAVFGYGGKELPSLEVFKRVYN